MAWHGMLIHKHSGTWIESLTNVSPEHHLSAKNWIYLHTAACGKVNAYHKKGVSYAQGTNSGTPQEYKLLSASSH